MAVKFNSFMALAMCATALTPVAAYVLIVLAGPYRAFDRRYVAAARALAATKLSAWRRVTLPLLKAPLLTAAAIGFAVSIAQFVPAQLIAAGRSVA